MGVATAKINRSTPHCCPQCLAPLPKSGVSGQILCSDVLYGSFSDHPRHFKAGEQVAQRTVLFFVEVTPRTTSALSKSFIITGKSGSQILRLKLPEGGHTEVPLLSPNE